MTKSILRRTAILFFSFAALVILNVAVSAQSMFDKINDFDGDGRADFAVTRIEGGFLIWHIWQSTGGYRRLHWGVENTDVIAPGDYDGDGKTDTAIIRRASAPFPEETTCNYHILRSLDGGYQIRALPLSNPFESQCNHIPQDYDGDGKTDPAIWGSQVTGFGAYYRSSTDSITFIEFPAGHFPILIGDTDGDGAAEISSYMEQTPRRVRRLNFANGSSTTTQWGIAGDIYAPADFDGDNIGDLTIFRPSTGDWWWLRSSDLTVAVDHWGINGDFPVPADYDQDGKTDRAIYRQETPNGIYYIQGSLTGFRTFPWGIPGDRVVRYQR